MQPSQLCYELIKHFEGCKLVSYKCSAGVDTIGWGSTFYLDGKPVKAGDKITQEQADALLPSIVKKFSIEVLDILPALPQYQHDALVSFCYNCGIGNFRKSTLLKKIKAVAPMAEIKAEFLKWDKANGKQLTGLTRRRKAEAYLFETGKNKFDWV